MRALNRAGFLALASAAVCCALYGQQPERLDVIHKPEAGCAADRVEIKGLFLEINGTRKDACVAHSTLTKADLSQANVSYDYLVIGESIEFELVTPAQNKQSNNREHLVGPDSSRIPR